MNCFLVSRKLRTWNADCLYLEGCDTNAVRVWKSRDNLSDMVANGSLSG